MISTELLNSPSSQIHSQTLKLTPNVSQSIGAFLQKGNIHELVQALGSPLNLIFPQQLSKNLDRFQAVLDRHKLKGKIYFAHKANRSDSIPRYLATTNAFIDVSSLNELRHALASGFKANKIQATGPKSTEFLNLCLQHEVVLALDSLEELAHVKQLSAMCTRGKRFDILLRLSGFKNRQLKHQGKTSRFGIKYDDGEKALDVLESCRDRLNLVGFSFHLDTVSALEKAVAAESCLSLFEIAFDRDFEPRVLNIGGGFKLSYLESADDWDRYNSAMREAALGSRPALTWQGNSFGLVPDKGTIRGSFNSYRFYDSSTGADFLSEILSHQMENHNSITIAQFLHNNGIELWIEPGRALLDQVGLTVARVNSTRTSSQDDQLICLHMKRQDLCFIDQEMFVDPIMLYRKKPAPGGAEQPVYFAGNLCLESDLITRHQTFITHLPDEGDLVGFVNTAGYFMDFSASEAIMQPIAAKVAIFEIDSTFGWALDENYYPWLTP